ncbi:MAG: MerR family transcriptional regulator [Bacillota bacterium]
MKDEASATPVYSMGVAERLTGLTARQIRYWEKHGLLAPSRTRGRQRMYSEADILRLKEIKRLMHEGMTLERVKAYYAAREARRTTTVNETPSERFSERLPTHLSGPARSLYTGGNRAELQRLIDRKKST